MYEPLLFIHSWLRWVVLLAILYFAARSYFGWAGQTKWTSGDAHFVWAFNQLFGYQVLFGLTLWLALSPFSKAGFKDPSMITENSLIFFWTIRHGLTMIITLGVFHMGKGRARKSAPEKTFKIYALTMTAVLFLITSAIPWPWLSYGRAFFRWLS